MKIRRIFALSRSPNTDDDGKNNNDDNDDDRIENNSANAQMVERTNTNELEAEKKETQYCRLSSVGASTSHCSENSFGKTNNRSDVMCSKS